MRKALFEALAVSTVALATVPAAAQIRSRRQWRRVRPDADRDSQDATPASANTAPAGDTASLGARVAEVVTADLKNSGLFKPRSGPTGAASRSPIGEVTAPDFAYWGGVHGRAGAGPGLCPAPMPAATLTVGCYLYDVAAQTELVRAGLRVSPARLAPRGAQMRRRDLRPPAPARALFRQPASSMSRRPGPKGKPRQAARDHGPGWRQPPLPDQRPERSC